MKELSIEEKAKAYDEALKWMRDLYPNMGIAAKEKAESIFHELRESENEEIRKWIINEIKIKHHNLDEDNVDFVDKAIAWLEKQGNYHKGFHDGYQHGVHEEKPLKWTKHDELVRKEAISCLKHWRSLIPDTWNEDYKNILMWLENEISIHAEKQGEQKPADKVEPKFKVGDWIIDDKNRVGIIVRILDEHYIISFDGREVQISFEWEGKLFRKWSIKDAKDGDVLVIAKDGENLECIFIFKDITGRKVLEYCYLITEYNRFEPTGRFIGFRDDIYQPATKEQRELLFQKMKEAGYEFDFTTKELKKIEQKPAWSEEDEEMFEYTINLLNYNLGCRKWLQSLKERYIWKLSDEQMRALEYIIDNAHNTSYSCKIAKELLEQLRRLKGE